MAWLEGWEAHEGAYWAMITATTVGFGDYAPVTLKGRLLAILLQFFLIAAVIPSLEAISNKLFDLQVGRGRPQRSCNSPRMLPPPPPCVLPLRRAPVVLLTTLTATAMRTIPTTLILVLPTIYQPQKILTDPPRARPRRRRHGSQAY